MDAGMESESGSPPDIWKRVFEAMSEGCAICEIILDENGRPLDYRHLHVNRAFGDLSERLFSHGNILGRTARELFPGLEDNWVEFFGKVALTGEPATWTSYVKSLGRWMNTRAFSLGGGRFAYLMDDVTDRHIIEVERAKFALLVEESNDFISMSDFEGNCTFLNAAGRHLVGLERGEEKGKRVRDFVFKEDWAVAEEALRTAVRKGSWQGEGRMRNFRTGRSVPVHGSFFTLKDPTGQPFAIAYVCRDLTFTHEREEQIRQAQKMEAIGKLAGGVAHDFNNLLTAINGYSDMLLEITPEGDSRREFLLEIRGSGQRGAAPMGYLSVHVPCQLPCLLRNEKKERPRMEASPAR